LLSVQSILNFGAFQHKQQNPTPWSLFGIIGYPIAAGGSDTLSYSGQINLGFGLFGQSPSGVVSGDQYEVTVIGQQGISQISVVAT